MLRGRYANVMLSLDCGTFEKSFYKMWFINGKSVFLLFAKPTKGFLQATSFHKCDEILLSTLSTGGSHAAPGSHCCFKGISWCCCDQNVMWCPLLLLPNELMLSNLRMLRRKMWLTWNQIDLISAQKQTTKNKSTKTESNLGTLFSKWTTYGVTRMFWNHSGKSSEYEGKEIENFFVYALFWCLVIFFPQL